MKIAVIGGGVVGQATARCYLEHCDEIVVWDKLKERCTHGDGDTGLHCALSCDLVFTCLPETQLDSFFTEVHTSFAHTNFVLKSTVAIGTTKRLAKEYGLTNIVHSPEFLTARCATTDAQIPARNIIGSPYGKGSYSVPLLDLYRARFPGIRTFLMSSDESETVKLMTNSFFACKIAVFNEFRFLCDKLGLDWETVRAGILSDGRIAHAHTSVPGPDGKYGFGGACLVKDTTMLVEALAENDITASMCWTALLRNTSYRTKI